MNQTISVIGLGYVGLPLALLAESKGYNVIGIDSDHEKVAKLQAGHLPFVEKTARGKVANSQIVFAMNFELITPADIIVICVPTPIDSASAPDLGPVRSACEQIAKHLRAGQLVILESTVNPGVSESVVLPVLEAGSGLAGGRDFYLAHCPERINPGDEDWHVANIPRVLGSLDEVGLAKALEFYRSIIDGEIRPMASIKEAEAVKVVENSFRDINIAFVNELAMSFDKLGIDVVNVIEGAASKPFAFMAHFPGCGVGGHCIPVDPYYLIEYARQNGFDHEFLSLARNINRRMPQYTAELTARVLDQAGLDIKGARVAVLGMAYKADIDDTRESPAFEIIEQLQELGADVVAYDPYVTSPPIRHHELTAVGAVARKAEERRQFESSYFDSLSSVHQPLARSIEGADAVVIATGHRLFREIDPSMFYRAGVKAIVDGRNCLDKARIESLGIVYKGIGH